MIAITCVPVLGTLLAVISTTEPDLLALTPVQQRSGEFAVLNWFALREGRFAAEASVQALGYMSEGDRPPHKGEWVRDFVLLPDAGNLLHPAHRIPDEMIAVHLRQSEPIQFIPLSLVWVWGTLQAQPGDPAGSQPLFRIDRARAKPADKSEISRYFR